MSIRIAIIGAGMTAASAASALRRAGATVEIFDKARGAGGRMTSKRALETQLDLGAQYFTARTPEFMQHIQHWLDLGCAEFWHFLPYSYEQGQLKISVDSERRFVGMPGMHQVVKVLLDDCRQHYQCRITELSYSQSSVSSKTGGQWTLSSDEGASYPGFDAVLLTCPPEQSRQLLGATHEVVQQLPAGLLQPCWAVLLELKWPVRHQAEAIFVKSGPLSWCARQSAKPGRRAEPEQWLVHFGAKASLDLLESTPEELTALARLELSLILGEDVQVSEAICHRWLYASYNPALTPPGVLFDASQQLALAGDWSFGGRVENAFLAGQRAAELLLGQHSAPAGRSDVQRALLAG